MKHAVSSPRINQIIANETLLPPQHSFAAIDITLDDGVTWFGQVICFGYTQDEADHLAALVVDRLSCIAHAADARSCTECIYERRTGRPVPDGVIHTCDEDQISCGPCSGRRGYPVFHGAKGCTL